ncbi:hypothetical protein [uncultured Lamprocystis sp.]|jgi:PleD family two-component response regulator|uniref:hypothetical protein n=1 Tax=uncultured Lamprocystis sp. TaxID=543132 RepID=UPI0025D497B0|nr:hypothetical protein [uncultured Lamprocystis sp.]
MSDPKTKILVVEDSQTNVGILVGLLAQADGHLYTAKRGRRHRVCAATDIATVVTTH